MHFTWPEIAVCAMRMKYTDKGGRARLVCAHVCVRVCVVLTHTHTHTHTHTQIHRACKKEKLHIILQVFTFLSVYMYMCERKSDNTT